MSSQQPQKQQLSVPWIVRPYREGDEQQATALYNRIFNKSLTVETYRWKVIDTPWPVGAPTAWMADARGQIAGQYAATAMRCWLQKQEVKIVHVCDVMTHPDFRRQGILSAVGETAHKAWKSAGVAFITGFPHKGWGSRSAYLNWQTVYPSVWLWRPLRPDIFFETYVRLPNFLSRLTKFTGDVAQAIPEKAFRPLFRDIEVRSVDKPGEEFNRLWEHLKEDYDAVVIRDRSWVTYRFAGAPGQEYSLLMAWRGGESAGYLASRLRYLPGGPVGYIADLFTASNDLGARLALLIGALKQLSAAGAKAVLAVVPRRSTVQKAFHLLGFFRRYGMFDVSIVPLQEHLPLHILKDPQRWFTMGGDFDVV